MDRVYKDLMHNAFGFNIASERTWREVSIDLWNSQWNAAVLW